MLQIVCGYHALPLPPRGCEIVFQPLEHLQAIEYIRPPVSALGFSEEYVDLFETSEVFFWLFLSCKVTVKIVSLDIFVLVKGQSEVGCC